MKLEYHPLFQTDLDNAVLYYLKEGGKALAERFIDEVEQGIFRIVHNPLSCSKCATATTEALQRLRHPL